MSRIIAAKMTEAELEENIRAYCDHLGILRFHVRDSRGMTPGLPDDILIGYSGLLWRECKSAHGQLTAEQKDTGYRLYNIGQDFGVWRPADLMNGRVMRELIAIAGDDDWAEPDREARLKQDMAP